MKILSLGLAIGLFVISCTNQHHEGSKSNPRRDDLSVDKHSEQNRDESQFNTSEPLPIDVEVYSLSANFDWTQKVLKAQTEVTLVLLADLAEIPLNQRGLSIKNVTTEKDGEFVSTNFRVDAQKELLFISSAGDQGKKGDRVTVRIQYEVPRPSPGRGLQVFGERLGDPIQSRALYTLSEPDLASVWMPCHDYPSDRALWKMEMTMPSQETFISNGAVTLDEINSDNIRKKRFETSYPLPTYLVAFAVGDFVSTNGRLGSLPVSIWHRRGLPADGAGLLEATIDQISRFQKLVGPYPFEQYSVVLLPGEFGGMEHAGITFNAEDRSSQATVASDYGLLAHELGHQWFGDAVTVKTWDDLWIKEGMATFLAAEAARTFEDQGNQKLFMGNQFWIGTDSAAYDPKLPPREKYTDGPYGRAAWIFAQMKKDMGDDAFYHALRQVLKKHMFSSVSSEEFLEFFRPSLRSLSVESIWSALKAKKRPELQLQLMPNPTDPSTVEVTMHDPESSLLSEISFEVVGATGVKAKHDLKKHGDKIQFGVARRFSEPFFVVFDRSDVHPSPHTFLSKDVKIFDDWVLPLFAPHKPELVTKLLTLEASAQMQALSVLAEWSVSSDLLAILYEQLKSSRAQFSAIRLGCDMAQKSMPESAERKKWQAWLDQRFIDAPIGGLSRYESLLFSRCTGMFSSYLLKPEYARQSATPTSKLVQEDRTFLLSHFSDLDPLTDFEAWRPLADYGSSIRLRMLALGHLAARHESSLNQGSPESARVAWRRYHSESLLKSQVDQIRKIHLRILKSIGDSSILPVLVKIIRNEKESAYFRGLTACTAFASVVPSDKNTSDDWSNFLKDLGALDNFPATTKKALEDPIKNCREGGLSPY